MAKAKAKKTVIIDNRMYKMPDWNFGDIRKLEANGFSIMHFKDPMNHYFAGVSAFVAVVAGVDTDMADELLEAHVENGGSMQDLFADFIASVQASAFFGKMMENAAKAEKKENQNQIPEAESENA